MTTETPRTEFDLDAAFAAYNDPSIIEGLRQDAKRTRRRLIAISVVGGAVIGFLHILAAIVEAAEEADPTT